MTPAWSKKNIRCPWSLSHDWDSLPLPSLPSRCSSPLPLSNRTRRRWLSQKTQVPFLDVKCVPYHVPAVTPSPSPRPSLPRRLDSEQLSKDSPEGISSLWAGLAKYQACSRVSGPLCREPGFTLYPYIRRQNFSCFYLGQFLCPTAT